MAVVELRKCLITLVVLYVFAVLFALVASVPMIMHVYPQSECLLFSSENQSRLYYGHWACELLSTIHYKWLMRYTFVPEEICLICTPVL